ncbi:intersectin-1-like isoform X2 [Dreissena polymorpha]|uniref:intersectin-1-like isoform X2 n=1 Tax=Dreissena polymorpha TaxID=45954 RepID=UPI0022644E6D|nr:intersectin-1-like isoform X2 [Dreissena polymorpha]
MATIWNLNSGSVLRSGLSLLLVTDEPGELLVDTDHGTKHLNHSDQDGGDPTSYLMGMEHTTPVGRSTSDACKITLEAARKRRERKERPYKSDPFSGTEIIPAAKRCALREERERLGRHHASLTEAPSDEIFSFLGDLGPGESYPSLEELQEGAEQFSPLSTSISQDADQLIKVRKNPSNVSSLSTDSGVIGQDGSHDSQQSSPTNTLSHSMSERHRSAWQHHPLPGRSLSVSCGDLSSDVASECPECNSADQVTTEMRCPSYQLCTRCCQRRLERKKTIQEVMETEVNYGRDLSLLKEEFYQPMLKAGLLTQDQLDTVFLNLDELIHVNRHFISKLRSAIHSANANNDNDLQEVMIGNLFLESSTMFLTFENYCVNQSQAPVLLEQYEREKELVRIFLQALQNDNQQLRRMHLKSFLMVPVQRIMKYPLLLDRLYRNTSGCHGDKLCLREAKNKIEDILTHINARSQTTIISRQRKASSVRKTSCSVSVKMEVSRVALETLKWKRKEVCDIISGQLLVTQPLDHLWASKRCKNYKFTMVYGVLMTSLETISDPQLNDSNVINDNNNGQVKSAAVVLIREKGGRFQVFREPFMLDKCIVSQDKDFLEVFEILEWNKDAFIVKAETIHETKLWLQHLRQQMNRLGNWRKRRNAMPNILLNHNH